MNVPNALTVARIFMIPLYIWLWFASVGSNLYTHFLLAAVVFAVASITDFLDGKIARSTGQITNFGKIADPIADKLLTFSAYFCIYSHIKPKTLTPAFVVGVIFVAIILLREIGITVMRMVYLKKGVALAAGIPGKIKTVFQIILLITAMLFIYTNEKSFAFVGSNTLGIIASVNVLIGIIMILTVFSGVYTVIKAKKEINSKKD